MIKFLILGFVLFIVIFTIASCSNKVKKKEMVLGQELADANQKENERLESGNHTDSPMPDFNYSKWKNEKSLINPHLNKLDSFIADLTNKYVESDDSERQYTRNSLSQEDIYTLFTFCQRAVIFGLRDNGNESYLAGALNTLSMVDPERCDFRDALVAMAFVNHGIKKAGLNSKELYSRAVKFANPKMAELLNGFESRKEADQSLETMVGYTEIRTESGIGFVQYGYEKFEPSRNLFLIGFKISEFVESEKYQGASITVAESLPLIWVNGENNSELKIILNRSSGTVSVSASPKEEWCTDWISQMFLLYLIECENQADANRIVEIANQSESRNHSKIVLNVGNVFCILITRATAVGVEAFEDDKSIERFKEPLEQLIKESKNN